MFLSLSGLMDGVVLSQSLICMCCGAGEEGKVKEEEEGAGSYTSDLPDRLGTIAIWVTLASLSFPFLQ